MLPALQNSGRAKWGSARADRILQSRALEKNGISFAGICKSPDVNSCPRFLLFPSAAPVGCDLRDLGSPSLHRNLQNRWHRILNMHRNLFRDFDLFDTALVFSPPQTYQTSLLGSGICFLRARRLGRGAWFVGCSWHTVPSWSAAHEVQDMLLLRARAAARPVQGMRRQQQLLRAPAAALLLQLQGVWRQQLLRAQAAAQPVQGVSPQQLLRARAPARLLQL